MRDIRFALIMVLAGLLIVRSFWRNGVRAMALGRTDGGRGAPTRLLLLFFGSSYVVWLMQFSIYRYAATLDLLSGLILVLLVTWLLGNGRHGITAILALSFVTIATTQHPSWGRGEFGERYIDARAPELPPRALVVMVNAAPMSYLIPLARSDARFVSVYNNMMHPGHQNRMVEESRQVLGDHDGPLLALYPQQAEAASISILESFGLEVAKQNCQVVRSMPFSDRIRMCYASRR